MANITSVDVALRDRSLVFETGLMAKQADGAVVCKYGDTVVLATAVAQKQPRPGLDFFPLTIDYQEKAYAAGKIPGGFFKREGRPSEREVLTSRLIDRPCRPLFPKGFYCETQGIANVLSYGAENVADIMSINAVSAALVISDIPWDGPVGAVRVGRIEDSFVINPTHDEIDMCDLNLVVAGTHEAVAMVEGGGNEVSESDLLEAIDIAHGEIRKIVETQNRLREQVGRPKRPVPPVEEDEGLKGRIAELCTDRIAEAIKIPDKLLRQTTLDTILQETVGKLNTEEDDRSKEIAAYFNGIEKNMVRAMILDQNVRADGRKPDEIRPISCQVGLLPRTHGSALFVRGETQALAVATLGTTEDEQRIDALEGDIFKSFMLHYNFPPFSVGEVKFLRSPGRREIGHGALAERGVKPALPSKEEFPYTIRVVSDILESNGSSSMATVCGASLALMDAGVPMRAPVAGIAMGLIKEGDKVVVLTDILGLEDHLGDMDFKVTGTASGVTAFQMDTKIGGISREIMENALAQAREGRIYILGKMAETISTSREEVSRYAPRIFTITIKPDKIRDIIGPGGKTIRGIQEQTGCRVNVEDSGVVTVASADEASARKAIDLISGIVEEPEEGRIYTGKVKRITDFGAFVEILPGTEGLLHISQIAEQRIEKVTDVIKEGEEVSVKVIEMDRTGRIRLSRKAALREQQKS